MKQKLLSLLLALISIGAVAQTQTIRFYEKADKLDVSTFVAKDGVTYTNLSVNGAVSLGEVGAPALPIVRHLIALPENATPSIKVKNYSTREFTLNELGASELVAPYQLSRTMNQREEDLPFVVDHKAYAVDAFVQNDIATVTVLGTLRGVQIAQVEINPVNYNPARGIVKKYSNIDVEVEYDAPTSEIEIPAHLQSPYFDVVYKSLFNNENVVTRTAADDYPEHPDLTKYPVRMLIIANSMFKETLKPYIEWKTQKGFDVEVAYTNEIGNIESYIESRYNSSVSEGKAAPSFLVLVGDVAQVPASKQYEWTTDEFFWSDYMYAQMNKGSGLSAGAYERFPEMYYGRLSAENTDQLKAIIDKIIYYEKYQFTDPSYLGHATIIAGTDGTQGKNNTYGRPQMKYLLSNYINADHGFTQVNQFGIVDENYDYSDEYFRVGFMHYGGHADQTHWNEYGHWLDATTIPNKDYKGMFSFTIATCCLSSDFAYSRYPCVGEYFLRQPMGGAVTYIGSSPTSHWNESAAWGIGAKSSTSIAWKDATPDNTKLGAYDAPFVSDYVSAGGILFCGNMAVTNTSIIGMVEKYWTGFNILGDPSLIPYMGEADPIDATYSTTIPVGATSYTVAAPQRSLVALSANGDKLLASALVGAEGSVTLSFDAIQATDKVMLVITKPQHQPIIANLDFGADAIEDITVSSTPEKIEVFNLQGVLVRTVDGEAGFTTDDLAPGTYIVVSTGDVDRKVEKVVVK